MIPEANLRRGRRKLLKDKQEKSICKEKFEGPL